MIKKYFKIILTAFLAGITMLPQLVLAENSALNKLQNVGSKEGPYQQTGDVGIGTVVGVVVNAILSLIGVIFLVLMLYAGYNWMIARGEEEKVTRAKDTITRAIVGLIIVVGSYAIWAFVLAKLF